MATSPCRSCWALGARLRLNQEALWRYQRRCVPFDVLCPSSSGPPFRSRLCPRLTDLHLFLPPLPRLPACRMSSSSCLPRPTLTATARSPRTSSLLWLRPAHKPLVSNAACKPRGSSAVASIVRLVKTKNKDNAAVLQIKESLVHLQVCLASRLSQL